MPGAGLSRAAAFQADAAAVSRPRLQCVRPEIRQSAVLERGRGAGAPLRPSGSGCGQRGRRGAGRDRSDLAALGYDRGADGQAPGAFAPGPAADRTGHAPGYGFPRAPGPRRRRTPAARARGRDPVADYAPVRAPASAGGPPVRARRAQSGAAPRRAPAPPGLRAAGVSHGGGRRPVSRHPPPISWSRSSCKPPPPSIWAWCGRTTGSLCRISRGTGRPSAPATCATSCAPRARPAGR